MSFQGEERLLGNIERIIKYMKKAWQPRGMSEHK